MATSDLVERLRSPQFCSDKWHLAAADEIERLRAALEEIVNPLAAMQNRARAEGRQLSGMAYSIANSVSYLQDIAKQALAK